MQSEHVKSPKCRFKATKKDLKKKRNVHAIGYPIVLILVSSSDTNVNDLFDRIVKPLDFPLLQNLINSAKNKNLLK